MKKKILITDDHYVIRVGISFMLEQKFCYPCITDFADNFTETLEKLSREHYDLLILDIDMPDTIHKAMIQKLKSIQKDLKILIFSAYNAQVGIQYINEGADGYIKKDSGEEEILRAISLLFEVGYYYPETIMNMIIRCPEKKNDPTEMLSERELQIFKLLVEGNGNIEIANLLDIKMSTVSTHKKNILEKLNVKTVVDLVRINDELH